ncbi:MAG: DUF4038 domain-containing protein [Phycisphaerae bacterium]|nr:DUF4038 domain-containing protein [Phycisphaerae bacterium]
MKTNHTRWMERRGLTVAALLSLLSGSVLLGAGVNGPIKVSPNGRYFVDRKGQPFFWLGDTAWPLFVKYSKDQAEAYLKNRSAKGFTVIQGVLGWSQGSGAESRSPGANPNGDKPWIDDDPARPNDAFFRHVDYLVEFAQQQGLVLAMLPTWGYYVNDTQVINMKNARTYGRWLGARYRSAPNIVWVNGGDRVATGFEEVWRELARGLREGDGGAHLITYHPCGWRSSSQYFHTDDWLDFNMIETWTAWPKIHPAVLADVVRTPVKPVVLGEPAYENGPEYPLGPITPLIVRRQAWWTVMAGGFFTYGQDQMWRMQDGWDKTFDTPGAAHVCKMKEIMASLPWWEFTPDQSVFDSGVSSEQTLNTAMRSTHGDRVLVYLSSQCTVFVHLDKIATARAKATLIHPTTGERRDAGTYRTGNLNNRTFPDGQTQFFSTPGHWEDALLLLEAVK